MIKITISNIKDEFTKLANYIQVEGKNHLEDQSKRMLNEIKQATPVDTGLAQSSWQLKDSVIPNTKVIQNEVPYIEALNHGHSKQAPPFFVEEVALKYGTPIGSITETYKS